MSDLRARHKGRKKVSFSAEYTQESNKSDFKSWHLVCAVVTVMGLLYVFWPFPDLTPSAVEWLEKGSMFHFKGRNIFYVQISGAGQQNLLILHGFPSSSYDWVNASRYLQQHFASIVIADFLGFGFSDKPQNYAYSINEQADLQVELLTHLNISRVHVLSHDFGDTVAQELIARQEESILSFKIDSLCLSNGGIIPSAYDPQPLQKLSILPVFRTILPYLINRFILGRQLAAVFGADSQPTDQWLQDIMSIMVYKRGAHVLPLILQYLNERQQHHQRWVSNLSKTSVPVHLIYGPLDPINTPEKFLVAYKQKVPKSGVTVLENIGHYPQIEAEAKFYNAYLQFYKEL